MSKSRPKVVLITNIPNPYRVPLFNELDAQLQRVGIDLLVVFGALGYKRRFFKLDMNDCNFRYVVLPTRSIGYSGHEGVSFTYGKLFSLLRKEAPDLVVSNAFSIATFKLWARSWFRKTPYLIWSGAIERPGGGLQLPILRRIQRRWMVKRSVGGIAYGQLAKRYLVSMGAKADDVFIGINTVDTEFYFSETNRIRQNNVNRSGEKAQLLCVTYLTPKKCVDTILSAVKVLSAKRRDFSLVIVGDGPAADSLKALAEELDIADLVDFQGFVQKQDIPKYLATADIFLFPTYLDVWGLVLVEAMVAGLPVLSSVNAGATHDLIEEGETGFAVDFDDVESAVSKIEWLLDHPSERKQIGLAASQKIISDVNINKSAAGFVRSIVNVLGS